MIRLAILIILCSFIFFITISKNTNQGQPSELFENKVNKKYGLDIKKLKENLADSSLTKAAERGMEYYISLISEEQKIKFGFSDNENPLNSKLDDPIDVYLLGKKTIFGMTENVINTKLLEKTNQKLMPLVIDNQIKSLLTMEFKNGKWRSYGLGKSALAKALNKILEYHNLTSDEISLVVYPPLKMYLYKIKNEHFDHLTPIDFIQNSQSLKLMPIEKLLEKLRAES